MIWSDDIVERVGDIAGEEMDDIPSRSHLNAVAHQILITIEPYVVPRAENERLRGMTTDLRNEVVGLHEALRKETAELEQLRRDSVLRSEMTEERRFDRRTGDRRFVTEWEPMLLERELEQLRHCTGYVTP